MEEFVAILCPGTDNARQHLVEVPANSCLVQYDIVDGVLSVEFGCPLHGIQRNNSQLGSLEATMLEGATPYSDEGIDAIVADFEIPETVAGLV